MCPIFYGEYRERSASRRKSKTVSPAKKKKPVAKKNTSKKHPGAPERAGVMTPSSD